MENKFLTTVNKIFKLFLVRGMLVGLPIIITVYIVIVIVKFFDNLIWDFLVPKIYLDKILPLDILSKIPGLGIIISVLIIIFIGIIASNFFGKAFIRLGDAVLNKIPFVKSLYSITKQIFDTVLSTNSNAFKEAVLVEFPQKGTWTIGFITSKTSTQITSVIKEDGNAGDDEEYVNVLVPTTPPTAGYLLIVKKSEVKYMNNIKVDQVMKFLISGGVLSIEDAKKAVEKDKK